MNLRELVRRLEKIEDKNGEVIVSALKAKKIEGWFKLEKAYEDNETIIGKIISKCKFLKFSKIIAKHFFPKIFFI